MMAFINAHVHASVRITTPLLLAGNVLNINVYWPYYGCIIMCISAIMAALLCIGCIMAALLLAGAMRPHCYLALMREWLLQYYQPLIPLAGSTRIVT